MSVVGSFGHILPRLGNVPEVLVFWMAKGPEEAADVLDLAFRLSVCLWVVAGSEAYCDVEQSEERLPNPGDKLGPSVRNNVFWNAKITKYMIKQKFYCLKGCG